MDKKILSILKKILFLNLYKTLIKLLKTKKTKQLERSSFWIPVREIHKIRHLFIKFILFKTSF